MWPGGGGGGECKDVSDMIFSKEEEKGSISPLGSHLGGFVWFWSSPLAKVELRLEQRQAAWAFGKTGSLSPRRRLEELGLFSLGI